MRTKTLHSQYVTAMLEKQNGLVYALAKAIDSGQMFLFSLKYCFRALDIKVKELTQTIN